MLLPPETMTKRHFLNLIVQYMLLKLVNCFQKRINLKITTKEATLKIQTNLNSLDVAPLHRSQHASIAIRYQDAVNLGGTVDCERENLVIS
jgi:hypothetical protein